MTQNSSFQTKHVRWLGAIVSFLLASHPNATFAQNITLDGTLGNNGPIPTFAFPPYETVYDIRQELGQTVGSNLFHSFGKFNLTAAEAAYFRSDATVRNLISRVTGGNASSIDGLIATASSNVNLFLINPSGIIFGPNARLNIGSSTRGSFVATTLDAIQFPNGVQFSATNPNGSSSLLTIVGDPSGFLASQRVPGTIVSTSRELSVYEGQSLLLLGGDITLNGSSLFVSLNSGGRIELGGLEREGTVGLRINNNILSLDFPVGVTRANVAVKNNSFVDATAETGGSITVRARNLSISNNSFLRAGIYRTLGSISSQAGDIILDATDTIEVESSKIANHLEPNAIGKSGNINILAASLIVKDGFLGNGVFGAGGAGDILLDVSNSAVFDNNSIIGSQLQGKGQGGNVHIRVGSLLVTNGSELATATFGSGNAGNITIDARQSVFLDGVGLPGGAGIYSLSLPGAIGKAGDITITSGSLSLIGGAQISGATFGEGNAGNVNIIARDKVFLAGVGSEGRSTAILSSVQLEGIGNGSDITISTPFMVVTDSATISGSTRGQGDGGNIIVNAEVLEILNGGQLITNTLKGGNAGNITLNITDSITLSGSDPTYDDRVARFGGLVGNVGGASGLFASTNPDSTGSGGNIFIDPEIVIIQNGAKISVESQGQGFGGNISIQTGRLELRDRGSITAETANAQGGNITLDVKDLLLLRRNSSISATAGTAQAGGDGGNITIRAPFIIGVLSENSDITANAFTGKGGNISITTNAIYGLKFQPKLTPFSDITASSEFGLSGTVAINTLGIDPNRGLVALPVNLTDPSQQIAQECAPRIGKTASSFVITGRGGLPLSPDEPLESFAIAPHWVSLPEEMVGVSEGERVRERGNGMMQEQETVPSPSKIQNPKSKIPTHPSPTPIIEAQGWIVHANGLVELVAELPAGDRPPNPYLHAAQGWFLPLDCERLY
jgi:filamentous hemagglutinin family protein